MAKKIRQPKFYTKKRTNAGRYITIAEGETRKELIDSIKRDSETYQKREGDPKWQRE
jgi:hypothetical protein